MPRQARLDTPGTLHHVMIRRIDALEIFRDDQDREDCLSRIPQLVGSIGKNIRLIAYGDYVHVHNKYLHLAHSQDHEEAGNREKKVIVFNNVPQNCVAATFLEATTLWHTAFHRVILHIRSHQLRPAKKLSCFRCESPKAYFR